LSNSLTKTKLIDPLVFSLLENIRSHRSLLEGLTVINPYPELSTINCEEDGKEFYIENEFHKAKGFRKLHIEFAEFSKNLKILHCVFFPDPKYDIPIFGMDLVKINGLVSAAIVDLSPVSKIINVEYDNLLSQVNKKGFSLERKIPDWGDIFSKHVFFASLKKENEQEAFCKIVDQYLSILIKLSQETLPDNNNEVVEERISYQKNYCNQQMKNEKTSMVLLKYFDKEWVDRYIKQVLFDF